MNFSFINGMIDDLSHEQMANLILYLVADTPKLRRVIKNWRRINKLPVEKS